MRKCKILRPQSRMRKLDIGSSRMYEAIKEGILAPFFSIMGARASGVFEHEDDEVLEARAADASDDQIREIVRRQVNRRKAGFDEMRVA